jgi:hypothetical protein
MGNKSRDPVLIRQPIVNKVFDNTKLLLSMKQYYKAKVNLVGSK